MQDDHGTLDGRIHVFGAGSGRPNGEVPSESTTLDGSVTGHLSVPLGAEVTVDGVLEEVVIEGQGVVKVAGLLFEFYTSTQISLLASPGSVIAPVRPDDYWHVLQEDGTWSRSPQAVFPSASAKRPWYPVPDVLIG
ncbi:hypothetical protein LG293_16975 (plasmid) [Citricoccus nitrophenolicus]